MYKKCILFICIFFIISGILYADPPTWQPVQGTQYSMVVMAEIYLFYEPFNGLGSNIAGAFGPGGESDCRSIAAWQQPNPPYWGGYWYFTIVGNDNGEDISFKIYYEDADSVYDCFETLEFQDNSTIGEPAAPWQLTSGTISVNSHNINELCVSAYPSPFGKNITFDLSPLRHSHFTLSIYDLLGRFISSFDENDLSEYQCIKWYGTDMYGNSIKPGVYFYKIYTKQHFIAGKILFIGK